MTTTWLNTLKKTARLLAELPEKQQTPQIMQLRCECVEIIKTVEPEYYAIRKS